MISMLGKALISKKRRSNLPTRYNWKECSMPYNEYDQIGGWIAFDASEKVYRVYWRGNRMRPKFTSRVAARSYLCGLRSGVRIAELDDASVAPQERVVRPDRTFDA